MNFELLEGNNLKIRAAVLGEGPLGGFGSRLARRVGTAGVIRLSL
jgi:threonine dehydrogenase-like Zn-dependent dehydrogenase